MVSRDMAAMTKARPPALSKTWSRICILISRGRSDQPARFDLDLLVLLTNARVFILGYRGRLKSTVHCGTVKTFHRVWDCQVYTSAAH